MPIHHAIWEVGNPPKPLSLCRLPSEQLLEDMIVREPSILSREWMLIGRQEFTGHGGRIDLLALAPDGSLVLVELKRERTPREIVAQALDYAAWVQGLGPERIAQIYQRFSGGASLDEAFRRRFGVELDEETLNASHQIVIVASALDAATERILAYLNARDIAINALFFQVFQHGTQLLLSRAWLIDPDETQANVVSTANSSGEKEPWNGEFYVSFGGRDWESARHFGYISGGGGRWYSQTLRLLKPRDRIWVKIPGTGYVGVGRVVGEIAPASSFMVRTEQGELPALEVLSDAPKFRQYADDPEMSEYFVPVQWMDTVPESKAFNEVGLFGNQNTVCQPTTPKWRHTIERLKSRFPAWNSGA